MTISVFGDGAVATGSTSVAPSPVASVAAGHRSLLWVGTKPSTATIATPSGWTLVFNVTGGIGTNGIDTGPTRLACFLRDDAFSGAQTVTITNGNTSWGHIITFAKDAASGWDALAFTTGDDTTGGSAAYSATGAANPGWVTGDLMDAACVIPTDAQTGFTAFSLGASGITGGTVVVTGTADSGTGNDIGGAHAHRIDGTGTATGAPTYSLTFTGATNTYGPCGFVRLREVSAQGGPVALDGSAPAAGSATGSLTATRPLSGTAPSASAATGVLALDRPFSGASTSAADATGALSAARPFSGASSAASSATGDLTVASEVLLDGTAPAAATITGTLALDRPLAGAAPASSSATGTLAASRSLTGTAASSAGLTGTLLLERPLTAVAASAAALDGVASVERALAAAAATASSATGELTVTPASTPDTHPVKFAYQDPNPAVWSDPSPAVWSDPNPHITYREQSHITYQEEQSQ